MKNTKLILVAFFFLITSEKNYAQANKPAGNTGLTDFITYDVRIIDPTIITFDSAIAFNLLDYRYNSTITDYIKANEIRYFNRLQSIKFKKDFRNLFDSKNEAAPKSILLIGDCGEIENFKRIQQRLTPVDSVLMLDENGEQAIDMSGNTIYQKIVLESLINKAHTIRFFEEWKMNKLNGMLEKNVLGYCVIGQREKYSDFYDITFFGIAKDQTSLEKIKYHMDCEN